MSLPYGETVTIQTYGEADKWGQKPLLAERASHGWGFAPSTGTGGQRSSIEDNYQRNTVSTVLTGYGPPGEDLTSQNVIRRADGTRYHVDGEPGVWRSPLSGWAPGVEVALRRVTG